MFVKSADEVCALRVAGRINASIHRMLYAALRPGMTTEELDAIAAEELEGHGAVSSFQGVNAFPAHICVSVNDEIGHGLPGKRVIQNGDLVKIDIGVQFDGMHSDCARTYLIGNGSAEARRLLEATKTALNSGIAAAHVHARASNISNAVWRSVRMRGFDVVRGAFGHGIGHHLHEDPQLPNFGPPGLGPVLLPQMAFAIEPVVVTQRRAVRKGADGWTECTVDGSLAAHFEDTILLHPGGPEILTR